jgi:hypothetical protein
MMSGPKVVRIVTREEIITTCESLLVRLDAAIARWQRVGRRNGMIDENDLAAVDARRAALRELLAGDRFIELQKKVPMEIASLHEDLQQRLERAAAAVHEARRAERRVARTAETLLDRLTRAGIRVPDELRHALLNARQSGDNGEAACARAFALLHQAGDTQVVTERQRQLAEELGKDERRVSFADWMASQPALEDHPSIRNIDAAIADLIVVAGAAAAAPFQTRVALLNRAVSGPHHDLLADSLLLDVVAELRRRQADADALAQLEELATSLGRFTTAATRTLQTQVEAAIAAGDANRALQLAESVNQAIAAEEQAIAAAARREAVLKGLAALGYEVTEGMATAWVESGRVVLRNTTRTGYGVEVGGGGAERIQLRAVALGDPGAPRDQLRDRDIETLWCGDVSRLRSLLADGGNTLTIEKAHAVGAVPLKVVATEIDGTSVEDTRRHNYLQRN